MRWESLAELLIVGQVMMMFKIVACLEAFNVVSRYRQPEALSKLGGVAELWC